MKRIKPLALLLISSVVFTQYVFAQSSTKGTGFVRQAAIPWAPCPTGTSCLWVSSATNIANLYDGTTNRTLAALPLVENLTLNADNMYTLGTLVNNALATYSRLVQSNSVLTLRGANTANSIVFDTAGVSGVNYLLQFNGTERGRFNWDGTVLNLNSAGADLLVQNSNNVGAYASGHQFHVNVDGTSRVGFSTTSMFPDTDFAITAGDGSHRWSEVHTRHIATGQAAAPTCVPGLALGTGGSPSCSCTGSDTAMACTFVTGAAGTTGGAEYGTVTFNTAFNTTPYCTMAAEVGVYVSGWATYPKHSSSSTTTMVVFTDAAPTAGGNTYAFQFHCIEGG